MKRVYLDHSATTYMDSQVKETMEPYWSDNFGNPSAIYEEGRKAKKAIFDAREKTASVLGVRPDEIIFTAGGTESDNMAVFGVSRFYKSRGNHIVASKIEHHAVLYTFDKLKKEGFEADYIKVDESGIVDLKQLKSVLKKETTLVSVMYANNEIGAIQPIQEIAKIIRSHRKEHGCDTPYFHVDAVQAPSYLDLNVLKLGVDLLTLNGSKIYGPKGIGCLYIKRGVKIEPVIYGGGQEASLRPGTENVPAIVGFAKALELAQEGREIESKRLTGFRDYFIDKLLKEIPDTILNGSKENRLPNNINVSFLSVEGEAIVLYLDAEGIASSTGSACSSDSLEPSHVITALKRRDNYAHGSVRFTMGKKTTKNDIDYVMKVLPGIIKKLRSISALDKR